jgi:hypothetical protein
MNNTIKKLSRRTDPQTSKDAAKKLVEYGRLTKQQNAVCFELFLHCTGKTAKELAAYSSSEIYGLTQFVFCRRLPELKTKGLAYTKGRRNGERIWFPK